MSDETKDFHGWTYETVDLMERTGMLDKLQEKSRRSRLKKLVMGVDNAIETLTVAAAEPDPSRVREMTKGAIVRLREAEQEQPGVLRAAGHDVGVLGEIARAVGEGGIGAKGFREALADGELPLGDVVDADRMREHNLGVVSLLDRLGLEPEEDRAA